MTKDTQKITRGTLGRMEAQFLARIGLRPTFSIEDARRTLGHGESDPTRQFLERLRPKAGSGVYGGDASLLSRSRPVTTGRRSCTNLLLQWNWCLPQQLHTGLLLIIMA